jgi:hypothetical protein
MQHCWTAEAGKPLQFTEAIHSVSDLLSTSIKNLILPGFDSLPFPYPAVAQTGSTSV